ncbi:hypothetical protein ACFLQN_02265 [Candidatus Aenigmatarchaeota archaeon]
MAAKKKWFQIIAPDMFRNKPVGETFAFDGNQLIGRKIEVSLVTLMKEYSRFYVKMIFQIDRVEEDKAYTRLVGHDVMRERIYRMVQRRTRRVDVVQDVKTKDNFDMRIKTMIILNRRVNTSIKHTARAKAFDLVEKISQKYTMEELMQFIIRGELQKTLKKECSKIYPVSQAEIRKTEIRPQKEVKEAKKSEPAKDTVKKEPPKNETKKEPVEKEAPETEPPKTEVKAPKKEPVKKEAPIANS